MSLQTWLLIFFLIPFSVVSNTPAMEVSYKQHCNSIVPEAISTRQEHHESFLGFGNGYYKGGVEILGQDHRRGRRKVSFFSKILYRTEQQGLIKVEGVLKFRGGNFNYSLFREYPSSIPRSRTVSIELQGFWSESSGKLCMVGSGFGYSIDGKILHLSTVLYLNYPKVSTIGSSLVTGSLKSLENEDTDIYFDPISILSFFEKTYEYSMLSKAKIMCSVFNARSDDGFLKIDMCDMINFYYRQFQLEYPDNCRVKNCNPFDSLGFLPGIMFIHEIRCSAGGKLRVILGFSSKSGYGYSHELIPEATLVGEGVWDEEKNELCMVGCHLLILRDSFENTTVGDCHIGLSFRIPAILSLRNRNGVVGQIWSSKNVNDSGYFERFLFRSNIEQILLDTPGLKYNYTGIDFANRPCGSGFPGWKKVIEKISWGRRTYPDGVSSLDMSFYMYVENFLGEQTWIHSTPLTIGESFYERTRSLSSRTNPAKPVIDEKYSNQTLFNVSYIITIGSSFNLKRGGLPTSTMPLEISAEGIYDADNGSLCMVGCRHVSSNNTSFNESLQESMDCEILISIQYPPQNPQWYESGDIISGTMKSTRAKSDPFYFDPLKISSYTSTESMWGIRVDNNMLLIFLTLASVAIGLQLYYVKNHPDGFPSVSLPMLVLLVVGHLVPLVFYFEAFFLDRFWIEYAVVMRAVSILAFLLQFCVLQSIWPARSIEGHRRKILWALNVCLPLYLVGALIASYVHWQVPALNYNLRNLELLIPL